MKNQCGRNSGISLAAGGLTIVAMLIVGCNQNGANPLRDYNVGQKTLSPSADQAKPEPVKRGPLFQVQVAGANDKNFATFIEGKENSVTFNVDVKEKQVQDFVLVPVNVPTGASLAKSADGSWLLKWTPAKGTVPSGKASTQVSVTVQARVTAAGDATLVGVTDPVQSFDLTVQSGEQTPTVLGLDGLKTDINTGDYFFLFDRYSRSFERSNAPCVGSLSVQSQSRSHTSKRKSRRARESRRLRIFKVGVGC